MAFFGSDGADNQVRQLKHQLGQKDAQITTYMQELQKKDDLLTEHKRAKEDATYKAAMEADRALKASAALTAKTSELQNTLMRLSNLESMLETSNEKARQDEKEMRRIQYELDSRSQSMAGTSRIADVHAQLELRVKSLEADLKRSESEKETLRAEVSGSSGGSFMNGFGGGGGERTQILNLENEVEGLRKENVRLMEESRKSINSSTRSPTSRSGGGGSFSLNSSSPTPRLKRTMSVSGDLRVHRLEEELDALRSQLSSGYQPAELDQVKRNLDAAKREVLKLTNEKMAVERSSQKELEDMKSQLSDVNEELEDMRAQQQLGGNQDDLEKLKKVATADRAKLEDQIRSLQEDLQRRSDEVQKLEHSLESATDRLLEMEAELERAVQASQPKSARSLRSNAATMDLQKESETLREQVADLTSRLEDALMAKTEVSAPALAPNSEEVISAQRKIRQMERELAGLKRDKAALEDDLDQNDQLLAAKDKEILGLRRSVPLPESRSGSPEPELHAEGLERLAALESDCAQLRELEVELRDRIAEQVQRIQETAQSLIDSKAEAQNALEKLSLAQKEIEAFASEKTTLLAAIESAQFSLAEKERDILQLQQQQEKSQAERNNKDESLRQRIKQLEESSESQTEIEKANVHAAIAQTESLQQTIALMQQQLDSRSNDDVTLEKLTAEKSALAEEISVLRATFRDLEAEEFGAKQLNIAYQEEITALKAGAQSHAAILSAMTAEYEVKALAASEEVGSCQSTLLIAEVKQQELADRINELESTLANQTTESDARIRDEGMFDIQEALARTQKDLTAAELERDIAIQERDGLRAEVAAQRKQQGETSEQLRDLEVDLGAKEAEVNVLSSEVNGLRKSLDAQTNAEGEAQQRFQEAMDARTKALSADLAEHKRLLRYAEVEYRFTLQASEDQEARIHEISQAREAAMQELQGTVHTLNCAKAMEQEVLLIKDRLEQAQDRVSVLELALVESEDFRKEAKSNEEALKNSLDAINTEFAALKSEKDALKDRVDSSGQPENEMVATLQREKREWESRVERRNVQLALEQDKIRKLELNLALASESLMDQEDSMNELEGKLTAAEAAQREAITASHTTAEALATTQTSLEASQHALSVASQEVTSLSILVNTLIAEVIVSLGDKRAVSKSLVTARKNVESTNAALSKATSAQDSLASQLGSSYLDIEQLERKHDDLASCMEQKADLHLQQIASWEAKLSASTKEVEKLQSELEVIAEEKETLSLLQQGTVSELASVKTRLSELEVVIDAARTSETSESATLRTQMQEVENLKETAEAALLASRSALEAKEEEALALSAQLRMTSDALSNLQSAVIEAEERISGLVADQDAQATALEASQRSSSESSCALSQALAEMKEALTERDDLAQQLSRAQTMAHDLKEQLSTLQKTHAEHRASTESALGERLADLEGKLADAEQAKTALSAQCEELQNRVHAADSAMASIEQSGAAAAVRISEATSQATVYKAELERVEMEMVGMREDMEARAVELAQAHQQAAEASSRLENSKMAIEQSDSRLRRLEAERTEIADNLAVAHKAIDTLQLKEADAKAQVQQLRSQLEAISHEVQAAPSVLGEIQELKAHNERLVAQCDDYVRQTDELDDQLKETNRILNLERKKREKVERKLKQLETAAPKTLADQNEAAPKRTTLATLASASSIADLHNQSPHMAHRTPSGPQKRGREAESADEMSKKSGVDVIVAPAPYDERARAPGTPRLRTPAGGLRSFTPQRSANRPKRMEEDQNLPPMSNPFAMEMLSRAHGAKSPFSSSTKTLDVTSNGGGLGLGALKNRVASFTAGEAGRMGGNAREEETMRNVTR